jgi:hypothetical protein
MEKHPVFCIRVFFVGIYDTSLNQGGALFRRLIAERKFLKQQEENKRGDGHCCRYNSRIFRSCWSVLLERKSTVSCMSQSLSSEYCINGVSERKRRENA